MNSKYEERVKNLAKKSGMSKSHWKDLQVAYSVADTVCGDEVSLFKGLYEIGFHVPHNQRKRIYEEYMTEISNISEILRYYEVCWALEDDPQPECGNGPDVPFGYIRMYCEYNEENDCIHCGEGMSF